MWKLREATNLLIYLTLVLVFTLQLLGSARALSDKRLCADPKCKDIISLGTGKISYRAGDYGMVSFKINAPIRIKSKAAGSDPSLWGIEVNGREGYAPKELIKEHKILVSEKNLITVDVEQKKEKPILSTSEKTIEQGNTLEATTTKPLDPMPAISTENLLNNSSNEKMNTDTLPLATPVASDIVEGTNIPIYGNDQINDNKNNDQEDKEQISDNNVDGNVQDIQTNVGYEKKSETENEVSGAKENNSDSNADVNIKNVLDNVETEKPPKTKHEKSDYEERKTNVELLPENSFEEKTKTTGNDKLNQTEEIGAKQKNVATYDQTFKENALETERNIATFNSTETDVDINDGNSIEENENINDNLINVRKMTENPLNEAQTIKKDLQQNIENERLEKNQDNLQHFTEAHTTDNFIAADTTNASHVQLPTNNINVDSHSNETKIETNLANNTAETENSSSENITIHSTSNENPIENVVNEIAKITDEETVPKESVTTESTTSLTKERNNEMVSDAPQTDENTVVYSFELDDDVENEKNTTEVNEAMLSDEPQKGETTTASSFKQQDGVTVAESTGSFFPREEPPRTAELLQQQQDEVESEKIITEANHVMDKEMKTDGNIKAFDSSKINDYVDNSFNSQSGANNQVIQDASQQAKTDDVENMDNISSFSSENLATQSIDADRTRDSHTDGGPETASDSIDNAQETVFDTIYQTTTEKPGQAEVMEQNISPTPHKSIDDKPSNVPLHNQNDLNYQQHISTSLPPYENHDQHFAHSQENLRSENSHHDVPTASVKIEAETLKNNDKISKLLPPSDNFEPKENKGLFATIVGTVNNVLNSNKKKHSELDAHGELDKILFPQGNKNSIEKVNKAESFPYCKNIGPNGDCPEPNESHDNSASHFQHTPSKSLFDSHLTMESFLEALTSKILEISELLAFLVIAAAASLFFVFGYYCFCNSSREGALLLKLNQLESSLLASHKENAILKHNLMSTRQKLASIEDNSFGSNDMVVSLKKELEEELLEKARLQEQVTVLQKELENAADAGIELNKIVSELLSNQTGDESIISSVEELQKQLNEQQNTIYEINASLAEKSRENSELQLLIAEQNARYEAELANVQRDNDELEHEKGNLLTRMEEMKTDFDKDITAALEGKNMEIKRLQNEIMELSNKFENEHTKWQTSVAKIEALEECLKNVRKDPRVNISEVINVANVKAQLIEIQKMHKSLKERFETELDARKLAENQLAIVSAEIEKLKQDFNQSEKDKLEAQTRLEVLSNYFKDKENQLQKELSLKEAMWLKQQGETTTTVDRVTAMQEEIQSLKSQNDSLRAEIEAQVAAHKAQIGTLENRAHETWLAARQSDRRYEEARAEATALRRKLTLLAGGNANEVVKTSTAALGDDLAQAPSPIRMESPGSPMLGRMPPPPFLPPPFMGPPPPFMGMPPPPPFVPPGEMRPAPLGRIMSPPPQRSGRFSPQHLDYEDYLDYESNNNTWHRHTYSPPPRTYRSLSPTDSRYNYGNERDLISTYDTETDFSPPPSPRESRRRVGTSSERIDSNTKTSYGNTKKFNTSNKGPFSSGSEKSFHNLSHNDTKTKKGSSAVGGKNLV